MISFAMPFQKCYNPMVLLDYSIQYMKFAIQKGFKIF